jgi:hypothetical protein
MRSLAPLGEETKAPSFRRMLHHFEPVMIWEKISGRRSISDVERAAEWLMERWPPVFVDTLEYRQAQLACLEAWEERAPAEYARAAFVVAAREAGILVE